ncbi:MAG: enoyl-CoA hydratase/isomerase family protein [Deltaproteobacteria bacterium]|nr:enoyl-CoA hydratase/isomerase family protein [Deltaproteobacteria bacterium]
MDYETISVGKDGGLAIVKVERPDALNALNSTVLDELITACREIELDDEVRVVVVTGAGKAFIAGADISQMQGMGPREAQAFAQKGFNLGEAIEASGKPYIAAVNGFALGGGCELALCCDFIYASARAKFGQPEVKLGVIPGFGGTQRLARRVGIAKAKELVFTGDMITAEEALRIGLVDAIAEPDELMDRVSEAADRIKGNGPLAVAEAKRVIQEGVNMTLPQGNLLEQMGFASLFATADQKEGMKAFLDKRPPSFKGE